MWGEVGDAAHQSGGKHIPPSGDLTLGCMRERVWSRSWSWITAAGRWGLGLELGAGVMELELGAGVMELELGAGVRVRCWS